LQIAALKTKDLRAKKSKKIKKVTPSQDDGDWENAKSHNLFKISPRHIRL
jgi:hypothetical protein